MRFTVDEPWRGLATFLPPDWLIATGLAEERPASEMSNEAASGPRKRLAIEGFQGRLKVTQEGRSYVIGIRFTSADPEKAAAVANRSAEIYVEDQLERERAAVSKGSAWLDSRLDALQEEVRAAEEAVERYRAEHGLIELDRGSLSDQELSNYNSQLIQARAELAQRQARLRMIDELRAQEETLEGIPEVVASPLYLELWRQDAELASARAELASTYGDNHPQMAALSADMANARRRMAVEVDRIVQALEDEAAILGRQIQLFENELDKAKNLSVENRQAAVRLRELERQALATRQLYQSFLERYKVTEERTEMIEPDVRVIASAVPPTAPSSASPMLFGLVGFTFSSVAGMLLALFLERADRAVRSGKQLETQLGLSCLSLVPELKPATLKGCRPHEYVLDRPSSAYAQALMVVDAALEATADGSRPHVIQITSSVPDEGKTTLAAGLATVIAQQGDRVVLLDLDLHKASVTRELIGLEDTNANENGNLDLTGCDGNLPEIKRDPKSQVDVLSFKREGFSAHRLLRSKRMEALISLLRSSYDTIIIDCPPALGMSDSKRIARLVDAILLLVRWGKTSLEQVRDARKEFAFAEHKLAGVVITRVDVDKQALYAYYGIDGHYSKYKSYYVD